ncbi:MAG: hypothetical protein OEY24_07280 [Candidatus Bathyarchaeota archaeon]|nr:hypothetical protein [Candidatus Bathyarchaeota archaeon]MDH5495482.1 hypothetical protein [Candidatus Bathyarchaeota archaeon]
MASSNHNAIEDNMVAFNYLWGMGFSGSRFNTVTGNTIKYTFSPFWTGAGFELYGDTEDNIIYHNNFLYNRPMNAWDDGQNIWDNGCEGNYWWEYTGEDVTETESATLHMVANVRDCSWKMTIP